MDEHYWIILNTETGQAWSTEFGWVDNDSYDLFTDSEKNALSLPMGGYWHDPSA